MCTTYQRHLCKTCDNNMKYIYTTVKVRLYSRIAEALSSTSTRASNASSSTSLTVLNTSILSNSTPTFAISNLSRGTTFTKIAKTTFTSTVIGSYGFSGKGIRASLTTLGKALVSTGDSIGLDKHLSEGLSVGHSHDKEKDSLVQNGRSQSSYSRVILWSYEKYDI